MSFDNITQGRLVDALDLMARSLDTIGSVLRARYDRDYPVKGEVKDATVTHRQTEEERLRETQGFSEESDEEWVGNREARFNEAQARKGTGRTAKRRTTPPGSH